MRRFLSHAIGAAALALVVSSPAQAIPISASFAGPDSGFSINLTLTNTSTLDIVSVLLDGSTSTPDPVLWDSAGSLTSPAGGTVTPSGEDTQLLLFSFTGFNPTEFFSALGMDPDGDPGPIGITVLGLLGTGITVTFADQSVFYGVFVDDPAEGAGLTVEEVAQTPVPEPTSMLLLGTGLLGAAARRWRRGRA